MTYIDFGQQYVPQGWQCPICKRVYAPDIPMCFYCGNTEGSTSTNTDTNINPQEKSTSVTYKENKKKEEIL